MERGLFPSYFLHLEREGGNRKVFLMAARRKRCSTTNSYSISLDATETSKTSDRIVGKLRSNFVGTHFHVASCAWKSLVDTSGRSDFSLGSGDAKEIAAVYYVRSLFNCRQPTTGSAPTSDVLDHSIHLKRHRTAIKITAWGGGLGVSEGVSWSGPV